MAFQHGEQLARLLADFAVDGDQLLLSKLLTDEHPAGLIFIWHDNKTY